MSKVLLLWQVGLIANVKLHFFYLQWSFKATVFARGHVKVAITIQYDIVPVTISCFTVWKLFSSHPDQSHKLIRSMCFDFLWYFKIIYFYQIKIQVWHYFFIKSIFTVLSLILVVLHCYQCKTTKINEKTAKIFLIQKCHTKYICHFIKKCRISFGMKLMKEFSTSCLLAPSFSVQW